MICNIFFRYFKKTRKADLMENKKELFDKELRKHWPLPETDRYKKYIEDNDNLSNFERGSKFKDFCNYIEKGNLRSEYRELARITLDEYNSERRYKFGPSNYHKNRYSDILPYRNNMAALPGSNSYMNASYISSPFVDDNKAYIATQGPLTTTIEDIWTLILQEKVNLVIMLCKFAAKDRPQCDEYFPSKGKTLSAGPIKISCLKEENVLKQSIIQRNFLIEAKSERREIEHYQWTGWPDHGVPEPKDYDTLLRLVDKIVDEKKSRPEPILVHCSAGIGRTGTLIAIANFKMMLQAIKNKTKSNTSELDKYYVSMFSIIRRMREERWGMVQTYEQYELAYEIAKIIMNSRNYKD